MQTYQTHALDKKGMSHSFDKLLALSLPASLEGWNVLDIGCNEGFFCNEAVKRGANKAVGIDLLESNLTTAASLYGKDARIEFKQQSWRQLPQGPFDLILWTSAMHYEPNPKFIIEQIRDRLSPNGLFVWEGGILATPGQSYKLRGRPADTTYYPTYDYLVDVLLRDFSVRTVSGPRYTKGDPVARYALHLRKLRKTVLFVNGQSGKGKSTLTRQFLSTNADNVISIDELVLDIKSSAFRHTALEHYLFSADTSMLANTYKAIAEKPELREEFAKWIVRHTPDHDRFVIIEGFLPAPLQSAIQQELGDVIAWQCSRL